MHRPHVIRLSHSSEHGTRAEGTTRGDGTAQLLKAAGFSWARSVDCWIVRGSRDQPLPTDLDALARHCTPPATPPRSPSTEPRSAQLAERRTANSAPPPGPTPSRPRRAG